MYKKIIPKIDFHILNGCRGSTSVEYAIIVVCIAVAALLSIKAVENGSIGLFTNTTSTIDKFETIDINTNN